MLAKITTTFSLAIASAAVVFAFLVVADGDPNTATLDADIANTRREIQSAEEESAKYSGGLIKTYIDLRLQILHLTEAMLATKRTSTLRRITLTYAVDREATRPNSDLSAIKADILAQQRKVAEAGIKAGQYSGGLVQGLALGTLETERLSLALLQLAFFGEKYGIPAPLRKPSKANDDGKQEGPGTVVSDKDAL
ncbi:MAG: hypothetical protein AB7T86_17380 [Xanthobacteraceae bacterium]|uniref:hypothetical protein n=1 Tax=Pseudolabrys sp. TaxID=1960880 RepID=UPI003D0D858B